MMHPTITTEIALYVFIKALIGIRIDRRTLIRQTNIYKYVHSIT